MGHAPLAPLSLSSSGSLGLNLQNSNSILEPRWATKAQNMVFDSTNRLTSRAGWSAQNVTPIAGSPSIGQIFEYLPITGSNVVLTTANNKIFKGTTTLTDITGALTPSANNWKFVNFNGNVYGIQASHPLIVWAGSGNFAAVTAASGTVPNGNELLSAFGRLWGPDSTGQVLKYSQLLDATNWNVTGAGSFNLTAVWGTGNDSIVALASFNNLLVVFGSRNIIIFTDNSGSDLGMDPINMVVSDIIPGIGCVARDTVQNTNGDDLVFLTYSGLQSLKRVIIERSNAIRNISLNIRDYVLATAGSELASGLRSTYNAFNGFYLLLAPLSGVILVFDTRMPMQDGTWRATLWDHFIPTALYTLHDNQTLYGGFNGQIFQYTGMQDNGTGYTSTFESGWLDLGQEVQNREKMLKRISSIFSASGTGTLTYKWAFDFSPTFFTSQLSLPSFFSGAQWGNAQWGNGQWGGGTQLIEIEVPASGKGQFIKVGMDFSINQSAIALNQMQLYAKVGRIV